MTQTEKEKEGGVVFRIGEDEQPLYFLPATTALKVMPVPEMARIPGAPSELRGVALVDGDMIPVIEVSATATAMLVCIVLGEPLGLVGIDVVATGCFAPATPHSPHGPHGVDFNGETATLFDVTELIARVREGRWAV